MRIALVSTFAAAMAVLPRWVEAHRAIGIERFYLFVDNPKESQACEALALDGVRWIHRDEALQAEWQRLPAWDYQKAFCHQVYSRQCLNTDYAIGLAREEGMDWLLHIDLDEKIHLPAPWQNLGSYFESKAIFDVVRFTNHEGVPEHWHIDNYLDEVTLFKRSFALLNFEQQRIVRSLFGEHYFLAYYNGKAAMNLHGKAQQCCGVHEFKPAGMVHLEHEVCVLHYTNCGFNWFYNKYATLGNYDDYWLDLAEIGKLFPIMEAGRQAVVHGNIHQATKLYGEQLMRQGGLPYKQQALLQAGILMRVGQTPPQLL